MTSKEAFAEWYKESDLTLFSPAFAAAWQAACEWQKHKDADIVLKVASTYGAPDAYWVFADAIRDQP